MKYRENPLAREVLEEIVEIEREGLLRFVKSRGIPEKDAERVLHETLERFLDLDIIGKNQKILEMTESEERRNRLWKGVKALMVFWMKIKFKEYFPESKKRFNFVPLDDETFQVPEDDKQEVRFLIAELAKGASDKVDFEAVCEWSLMSGPSSEKEGNPTDIRVLAFAKHLATLAKCDEREKLFLLKRVANPGVADKDLITEWSKATISRTRKGLFVKICGLLDLVVPKSPSRKSKDEMKNTRKKAN